MIPSAGFRALIQRAQARDPEAVKHLLAVLRPLVEKRARAGQARAGRGASDLVQEACLRVWQKLDQFRGTDDDEETLAMFLAWVDRVVWRLGLNARRRRPPPRAPLWAGPGAAEPPAPGPTPGARLQQDEQARRVRAALDRLDDLRRTILRQHFFEGASLRQIAERLDLGYDKVREHYRAGLRRLERELGLGP